MKVNIYKKVLIGVEDAKWKAETERLRLKKEEPEGDFFWEVQ